MKSIFVFFHIFFSLTLVFAQQSPTEELESLVIEAIANNPDIAAALAKMRMTQARIPQAGSLDDPQFTYKLMEFPGTRFGDAAYQNFELMQMIMFPTKLSTRKDIARTRSEYAHYERLEKILNVVAQLKSAHAMLWAARASVALNGENQKLLAQILQIAQTLYAVGRASQQDVLKTNIELAKLKAEEAALRQEIIGAESMLRSILNRAATAPIGAVKVGDFTTVTLGVDDLLAHALTNRPMVIHDSLGIAEGDLMVSMARQEYIPDFRVSLERVAMPMTGDRRWTVMAGISIPFAPWTLSKASARVEEATADREMRSSMYQATKNMVQADIRVAYANVKSFESKVQLFEESVLPQTEQSLRSLLSEYQTGKTSYIMLLDGYRMYQETKMEAVMARMRYEQARAMLDRQVGVVDLRVISPASKEKL